MVDNLVLLDRHRVKEDFLCEKPGRENAPRRLDSLMITKTASRRRSLVKTPSPRPGELKSFSAPVLTSSERMRPSFTRRPSLVTGICVEINRLASRHFGVAVYASIQKVR